MKEKVEEQNVVEQKEYWKRVIFKILQVFLVFVALILAVKCAVFLLPFLIAIIVNWIINPVVRFFKEKCKMGHKLSVILSVVLVIAVLGTLITLGIFKLTDEVYDFVVQIPDYVDSILPTATLILSQIEEVFIDLPDTITGKYYDSINDIGNFIIDKAADIAKSIGKGIISLPEILIYIIVTILATLFIGLDKTYIKEIFAHQLPDKWNKTIRDVYDNVFKAIIAYMKAVFTIIFITFCELLVGLTIIDLIGFNINYVLAVAVVIAIVDALPILGCGTVLIPWAVILAITGNISMAIAIFVLYLVITVVRQLIEPKIVSHNIGVHPIITLLAMFIGFKLFGLIGLIFGPITVFILKGIFAKQLEKGFFRDIFENPKVNKEISE